MLTKRFNTSDSLPNSDDFHSYVRDSNEVQYNYNWKQDTQPSKETIQTYMDRARFLRLDALIQIKEILKQNPRAVIKDDNSLNPGYYSLNGQDFHGLKTTPIDQLIEDIQRDNQRAARIAILNDALKAAGHAQDSGEVVRIGRQLIELKSQKPDDRFLKSEASAIRKVETDYTRDGVSHPEEVGDYLRFQILYETAKDIAIGRHILQSGKIVTLTAQKDRLRFPHEETSHRAFLARSLVSDGKQSLKFEIMLAMVQAETFGDDKTIRDSSRACKKMAEKATSHVAAYCAAAGVLDNVAKLTLCDIYDSIEGMNDLLDPSVDLGVIRAFAQHELERGAPVAAGIIKKLPKANGSLEDKGFHLH